METTITRKHYYGTFLALLVLLAATLGAYYFNLGPFNFVVAMSIAVAKALLVALFFMHVRTSEHLIWVVIVAALAWLILLVGGTAADFFTRGWLASGGTALLH